MSEFAPAIAVADLPPGRGAEIVVDGQAIALFNVGGHSTPSPAAARTAGAARPGLRDGSRVSCPWHNWTFDLTTGANVVGADLDVARYEVKVEDGRVFVKLR